MDLVVIPRRPLPVCERVSPMKPLEAAAQGKRVLLSTVAPLADLAEVCPRFRLFEKGNLEALTETLADALNEPLAASTPPCPALAELTWTRTSAPLVEALRPLMQTRRPSGVGSKTGD